MNRKLAGAVAIGAIALVAAGCDSGAESGHDAGIYHRQDSKRLVYNMPTGIPNIVAFCSLGNLIYESSRNNGGGFINTIIMAPQCKGVADGGVPHAG